VPNCGGKNGICASELLYAVDVLVGSCIHGQFQIRSATSSRLHPPAYTDSFKSGQQHVADYSLADPTVLLSVARVV